MSLQKRKELTTKTALKNSHVPLKHFDPSPPCQTSVILTPQNSAQEARTNQAFKSTCDINTILKRFATTGVLDHVTKYNPEYGELASVDFETAFKTVQKATEMFEALPANIRRNFHDKPENFLAFMEEKQNRNVESLLQTSDSRSGSDESPSEASTKQTSETSETAG